MMTYEELRDALDGLHAWDDGMVDSGIHDDEVRERVRAMLQALPYQDRKALLIRVIADLCPPDQGYGSEDVQAWLEWLRDEGMA